ncbi:Chitin synthase, class 3 [Microbotryomycetes sp. JL201]|nr:Chitin synthase, class 3 [Microbotryomycetes sp. JL201]
MDGGERPPRADPPSGLLASMFRGGSARAPSGAAAGAGGARPPRQERPSFVSDGSSASLLSSKHHPHANAASDNQDLTAVLPRVQFEGSSRVNLLPSVTLRQPTGPSSHRDSAADHGAGIGRKKSLVRPDRERIDPSHRLYNYRKHAAQFELDGRGVAHSSRTGHTATQGIAFDDDGAVFYGAPSPAATTSALDAAAAIGVHHRGANAPPANAQRTATGAVPGLRRGKSILAREEGMAAPESGLSMFKRGANLRRPNNKLARDGAMPGGAYDRGRLHKQQQRQPMSLWMLYCQTLTLCVPAPVLKCFGLRTKARQHAWREKIGLLSIILLAMAFVGYLTFGFTKSVCGKPELRYKHGRVEGGSMIFHGDVYDLNDFRHPAAPGIAEGTNPLYEGWNTGGMDGSFLFQKVNEKCLDVITPAPGSGIVSDGNRMGWYFPCNVYDQYGTSIVNLTDYAEGTLCHTQTDARRQFSQLKRLGPVYFPWDDLKNSTRNIGVYDGRVKTPLIRSVVLDFSLLNWLNPTQVSYPPLFDQIKNGDESFKSRDITAFMLSSDQRRIAECMIDIIKVGVVDSDSIGCIASDVVLYVSLVVIIGVVAIRFFMAVLFGWFLSWKIGRFPNETYEQRRARAAEIEDWTDDIYRPAPARYRPNVKAQKRSMLPKTSRFTKGDVTKVGAMTNSNSGGYSASSYRKGYTPSVSGNKSMLGMGMRNSPPGSPSGPSASRSSTSLAMSGFNTDSFGRFSDANVCPWPLNDVVPQPPPDYQPFNYPLVHSIMLVTAYSESVEGLRTTLDSLATTDYPNSHKLIMVIADGMVKGSGNKLTTPEIVLGMMKEFVTPPEDVEALSYVAIADGHKRHNMAKVFAGFYEYDNNTVEMSKQQRVPVILIAKVGNPAEVHDAKPGNRGKRDSQIVLMAFLQKVMFDERMTMLEYELFNAIWRCTGVSPDRYETVLCVDADTKIFPDSVSRMVACMVHDPEIMGLCGETKIANKTETWVTMIQVFEYHISHHLTKAFESVFGGVTCLPGCFSMYRIKAPKGGDGYWVPILANPDIVEHYSENVVDTLHKKNLLLLGEDRYLTTLMLRTFPRRKMMFCPQAVCKTVVPDTFRVLLSQRRRWINSTVHNLFELFVVPDLCGVFCFSMRFVVFMELAGTLVLPAAIAFTLYLIVVAIIPGTAKPVLSLILLAIILGLPGVLIVVTSRRVAYLGWMLVYLVSLPIWNFVLPAYAFLHMDDFTWGETRKIVGDDGKVHADKDGNFDSSQIVMKRWADYERERRYKSANQSRDSTYEALHLAGSPHRSASHRYSIVSSTDTYASIASAAGDGFRRGSPSEGSFNPARYPAQLELPAPLAPQATHGISPASSSLHVPSSSSSELASSPDAPFKVSANAAHHTYEYPRYAEGYDSDDLEREGILHHSINSPTLESSPFNPGRPEPFEADSSSRLGRPATASSSSHGGARSDTSPHDSTYSNPFSSGPSNPTHVRAQQQAAALAHKPRGVSLVDDGPVAGADGVRVVQRNRRQSSQQGNLPPSQSSRSRASFGAQLEQHQANILQSQAAAAAAAAASAAATANAAVSPSSSYQGSLPPGAAAPRQHS